MDHRLIDWYMAMAAAGHTAEEIQHGIEVHEASVRAFSPKAA